VSCIRARLCCYRTRQPPNAEDRRLASQCRRDGRSQRPWPTRPHSSLRGTSVSLGTLCLSLCLRFSLFLSNRFCLSHSLAVFNSTLHQVACSPPRLRAPALRTYCTLLQACLWGDPEAVSTLLSYQQGWSLPFESESGIGPLPLHLGLSDNTDTSPLMVAVQHRHISVVALLTTAATARPHPNVAVSLRAWPAPFTLSASSTSSSYDSSNNSNPSVNGNSSSNSTIASDLVAYGPPSSGRGSDIVNARDMRGKTALLMACNMEVDNLDIVQHLVNT